MGEGKAFLSLPPLSDPSLRRVLWLRQATTALSQARLECLRERFEVAVVADPNDLVSLSRSSLCCVVSGGDLPFPSLANLVGALRRVNALVPLIVEFGSPSRPLETTVEARKSGLFLVEDDTDPWVVTDRVQECSTRGFVSLLPNQLYWLRRSEEEQGRVVWRAVTALCHADEPILSVNELSRVLGLHRVTLWRAWSQTFPDTDIGLKDLVSVKSYPCS